jgi:hypothetical protein
MEKAQRISMTENCLLPLKISDNKKAGPIKNSTLEQKWSHKINYILLTFHIFKTQGMVSFKGSQIFYVTYKYNDLVAFKA